MIEQVGTALVINGVTYLIKPYAEKTFSKLMAVLNIDLYNKYYRQENEYTKRGMKEELEKCKESLNDFMEQLIHGVNCIDRDKIKTPQIDIIEPILADLGNRYTNKTYRKIYAQFIASTCNKDYTEFYHTGYLEVIKNMSPKDLEIALSGSLPIVQFQLYLLGHGYILFEKYFWLRNQEVVQDSNIKVALANLTRLGIIEKEVIMAIESKCDSKTGAPLNYTSEIRLSGIELNIYELFEDELKKMHKNKTDIATVSPIEYRITDFGECFIEMFK